MQVYSPVRQFSFIQYNLEQILGSYDFWGVQNKWSCNSAFDKEQKPSRCCFITLI